MTDFIEITKEKLDLDEITRKANHSSTGAISIFIGTTRDHFNGKRVIKLEYEAYTPMAKKEMQKICNKIRSKWQVKNIAIHHRLGEVKVTEASVIIAITSEHRKESLEALQFGIDDLKANVPIWKKEMYDNSNSEWKQNVECQWNTKTPGAAADDVKIEVDPNEIQITASNEVLQKRMESYMGRKRQEIDNANVLEFCNRHVSETNEFSCARTDSIVSKRKDCNSHLRQSHVVNPYGPQTNDYMDKSYDPLQYNLSEKKVKAKLDEENKNGVEERLKNMETKLGFHSMQKPLAKDIYERIKLLEDRINYLEGMSPEYFANGNSVVSLKSEENSDVPTSSKQNISNLNTRIQELQTSLKLKQEPM